MDKIKFINLTGHEVVILEAEAFAVEMENPRIKVSYPADKWVVRAYPETKIVGYVEDQSGIPIQITRTTFTSTDRMPPEKPGVGYIVSRLVASVYPEREDLYVVSAKLYNKKGHLLGAKGLAQIW